MQKKSETPPENRTADAQVTSFLSPHLFPPPGGAGGRMSPGRAPGLPPGALMGPDSTPALAHLQLYAMHNAGEYAAVAGR